MIGHSWVAFLVLKGYVVTLQDIEKASPEQTSSRIKSNAFWEDGCAL